MFCLKNNAISRDSTHERANAASYWSEVPATVDGVLGGFGHLNKIDIKESNAFLLAMRQKYQSSSSATMTTTSASTTTSATTTNARARVLDVGAGIGRTSQQLLAPLYDKVDVLEQDARFLDKAREAVPTDVAGHFYCSSMQAFTPTEKSEAKETKKKKTAI